MPIFPLDILSPFARFPKMFQDEDMNDQTDRFKGRWLDLWSKLFGKEMRPGVEDTESADHCHSQSHALHPIVAHMYATDEKTHMPPHLGHPYRQCPRLQGVRHHQGPPEDCGIKAKGVLLDGVSVVWR